MYHLPYLYTSSPLFVLQAALTVWMLVDASRRRVDYFWYWIILGLQPFGAWAYFFAYKTHELRGGTGRLAGLFHRPPSLDELRHRVDQAPTVASRLELAERLVETGDHAEAVPLLEAVLAREADHSGALFLLAQARRGLGEPAAAVPLLQKIVARQPGWNDYAAWYLLIDCCRDAGDGPGAVAQCRELVRAAASLEHTCLLAEHLLAADDPAGAKAVVERALGEYRYATGQARCRDRRWVGRAKQLLKQAG
jgi:hypothetical protein